MSVPGDRLPTVEDLQKLSRRAVVAYAACAARMVQPFFGAAGHYQPSQEHIKAIDDAIRIAEQFAEKKIKTAGGDKIMAAYAAASTAPHGSADAHAYAPYAAAHAAPSQSADAHAADAAVCAYAATYAAAHTAANNYADAANDAANFATWAAMSCRTSYSASANVEKSLRKIYEFLKKYDATNEDPIDFHELNIWENGKAPRWFINFIRQNIRLQQRWKKLGSWGKTFNPWNMLKIAQGESEETKYVPLPTIRTDNKIPKTTSIGAIPSESSHTGRSDTEVDVDTDGVSDEDRDDSEDTITPPGTKPELLSNTSHDNKACLGIDKIAAALGDVLIHSKESLCVGILGQWGSGKSRLMLEVEKHFEKPETQERERFVTIKYNAWKYRSTPENWAYLYECFAAKLRESSWFAMIRAGVIRYGLWPIILALFLISLPWFMQVLVPEQPGQSHWWSLIFGITGYGGGSAVLIAFLRQLYQSASSMKKGFTLPSHQDKLGLQAAIGDDFHSLIRGWTTIKPGEKFFQGQTLCARIVEIALYAVLWGASCVSISHLLEQFDHHCVLTALGATFLCITLLPVFAFIPMLIQWGAYWYKDEKNQGKIALYKRKLVSVKDWGRTTYTQYNFVLNILFFLILGTVFSCIVVNGVLFTVLAAIIVGFTWLCYLLFFPILIYCCKDDLKWVYDFYRKQQTDRILLVVDDLDRCEGDDLLEIMESIMLLCQDEQINKRLHVCMLVKSHTVEVKLREKYKYLLEEVTHGKEEKERRLIRENFEKLFDAHLSLPGLEEGNVNEVLRSFLDKLVTDKKKDEQQILSSAWPRQVPPTDTEDSSGKVTEEDYGEARNVLPDDKKPLPEPVPPGKERDKASVNPPVELVISPKERGTIARGVKNFAEPYENYWSPRSLKRLTTQYLLARSLLDQIKKKRIKNKTRKITATILHLQGFKPKNPYNPDKPPWFLDGSRESEIIRMVAW